MKRHKLSVRISFGLIALAMSPIAMAQVIQISNVEDLYSAVNNPANAGATLALAPGIYMLSSIDSHGAPRANGGRIELQPDMWLMGVEGDRDAVVIDAVNLPTSSFPTTVNGVATGPNAAVRMGLGYNGLEWLTVRDANAGANIDVGLQRLAPGTAYILLAHVASSGSGRGMNLINYGPQTSGQTIEADVTDCYFFDNPLGNGEGIRIGNFGGAAATTVTVRMNGNLSWGQQTGRIIETSGATDTTVNVFSSGNRFYDNGTGTIIFGAVASGTARSDGNTINFEAHGDEFVENTGFSAMDHGGLLIRGAENVSIGGGGGGSNNTVNITLWGCRMLDNTDSDLYGVGARTMLASTVPFTQNNHVTIEIHGDGNGKGKWQPVEFFANSLPAIPDEGNSVTVIN